jgi:hypothetical protein
MNVLHRISAISWTFKNDLMKLTCVTPFRRCQHSFAGDRSCTPRSKEFYEEFATNRKYFYVFDLRGQLFLEDSKRNIATSMKDVKFLDFMFRNLKWNTSQEFPEIPLLSLCGKEINYVTPIDRNSVLVFKDLVKSNEVNQSYSLCYGGTLKQPFNPSQLVFSPETGRMYHVLTNHKNLSNGPEEALGLLNVNITAHYFSENLLIGSDDTASGVVKASNPKIQLRWKNPLSNELELHDVKILNS